MRYWRENKGINEVENNIKVSEYAREKHEERQGKSKSR